LGDSAQLMFRGTTFPIALVSGLVAVIRRRCRSSHSDNNLESIRTKHTAGAQQPSRELICRCRNRNHRLLECQSRGTQAPAVTALRETVLQQLTSMRGNAKTHASHARPLTLWVENLPAPVPADLGPRSSLHTGRNLALPASRFLGYVWPGYCVQSCAKEWIRDAVKPCRYFC
jgi:hypothetical protein